MNDKRNGSKAPGQLKLRFPTKALSFGDMCVSEANETAFSIIRDCENWPTTCLCLIGPAASGLTTAILAWAEEMQAVSVLPDAFDKLTHDDIETMISTPIAIDRAELITNEGNLLYLVNRSQSYGTYVLLTGCQPPSAWKTSNADLRSRLSAMPIAELLEPDDALLKARLSAACRRRYVKLPDEVAAYLAARMVRSYSAIEDLATRLDKAMEEEGRKLTIPLAREVLAQGASSRPLFDDEDDQD